VLTGPVLPGSPLASLLLAGRALRGLERAGRVVPGRRTWRFVAITSL
jgi:hypothetical protein